VVPVGSPVHFGSQEYTFIGFLQRATTDDLGTEYVWQEYLLADNEGGYRWLVQDTEYHWSLFEPITGGSDIQPVINYGGKNYRFFQHGEARVKYLEGEFYWNASVGQASYTADFVAPPHMLAAEFSQQDSTKGETSWTHGVYLPVGDVRKALGTRDIPRPRGVAPNQPFPHKAILPLWIFSTLALFALGILFNTVITAEEVAKFDREIPDRPVTEAIRDLASKQRELFRQAEAAFPQQAVGQAAAQEQELIVQLEKLAPKKTAEETKLAVDSMTEARKALERAQTLGEAKEPLSKATDAVDKFATKVQEDLKPPADLPPDVELIDQFDMKITLKGNKNIRIGARAELQSSFLELQGILDPVSNEGKDDPEVQPFQIPIEYYSGTEEGEHWTEGDPEKVIYLSSLPEGEYVMHIQVYKQKGVGRLAKGQGGMGGFLPAVGGRQDDPFIRKFTLHVGQGYPRFWNVLWGALILAIIPLIVWIMAAAFNKRRWSNSNVNPSAT
jgi:hypothetical protein